MYQDIGPKTKIDYAQITGACGNMMEPGGEFSSLEHMCSPPTKRLALIMGLQGSILFDKGSKGRLEGSSEGYNNVSKTNLSAQSPGA